jgi:hypothetical protein
MDIKEIWIPETLIVIFMAVPAAEVFFRRSLKSNRLAVSLKWLQFIALCTLVAIFPAYGFRPECLPMLVFALVMNTANLILWLSGFTYREWDIQFRRKRGSAVVTLFFLTLAVIPMFVFSPEIIDKENTPLTIAEINSLSDGAARKYTLRVYGTLREGRPVIFIVPPEIGSAVSVDLVCHALQKKGFTAITYFCNVIDTPLIGKNRKTGPISTTKLFSYLHTHKMAGKFAATNERGKALEVGRRTDIQFLLPGAFTQLFSANDLPPVLLAGYGAGGSALAYLAGEGELESFYSNVLGVISIEGRFWSSYQAQPRIIAEAPAEPEENFFRRQWASLKNYVALLINPLQVELSGPLLDSNIPLMYLVSGRALENEKWQNNYQAVFDAMRSGTGPAALAVIESAGPLDYQDFPLTHPVYSFLLPGKKGGKKSKNPVSETADIIGGFASFLLEKTRGNIPVLKTTDDLGNENQVSKPEIIPQRNAVKSNFYFESKGLKGFGL